LPKDIWGVVAAIVEGSFPGINGMHKNVMVSNGGSKFKITVRDGTMGAVVGLEVVLDSKRERVSPQDSADRMVRHHSIT